VLQKDGYLQSLKGGTLRLLRNSLMRNSWNLE